MLDRSVQRRACTSIDNTSGNAIIRLEYTHIWVGASYKGSYGFAGSQILEDGHGVWELCEDAMHRVTALCLKMNGLAV